MPRKRKDDSRGAARRACAALPGYGVFVTERHWAGSWLSGTRAAREENTYPGQHFGLPEKGPRSVAGVGRRLGALFIDWLLCMVISVAVFRTQYLTIAVFAEARRVLVPGGLMVCTFSNRCFPTKAIRGWLANNDEGRCRIVTEYFHQAGGWNEPTVALCTPPNTFGDPLYGVWATTTSPE